MAFLASFAIVDELIDDLLLLAAGPDQQLNILAKLRFGLSGAELARLAAARRVDIVRRRIQTLGAAPTGDVLLDDALKSMSGGRNQPTATAWVARRRPGLAERYLARLESAWIIRVQRRRVLGFIPSIRWVIINTARAARARDRLQAIAAGTGSAGPADAVLAGLASATGVAASLYPGRAGAAARERLNKAARSDPAAATVTQAVTGAIEIHSSVTISGIALALVVYALQNLIEHHSLSIHSFQTTDLIWWFIGWFIATYAIYRFRQWLAGLALARLHRARARS